MSLVAIIYCLGVIFLCSRPSFNSYHLPDTLALLFIFVILIGYIVAFMLTAWLLGRHHRFVCPSCGKSLVFWLDSVQKTGKCGACHSEVFRVA